MRRASPHPMIFFLNSPAKTDALHEATLPLRNKAPQLKLVVQEKKPKIMETVINTCVSLIKQHWKKIAVISSLGAFTIL